MFMFSPSNIYGAFSSDVRNVCLLIFFFLLHNIGTRCASSLSTHCAEKWTSTLRASQAFSAGLKKLKETKIRFFFII